jgi:hypothetical protein
MARAASVIAHQERAWCFLLFRVLLWGPDYEYSTDA